METEVKEVKVFTPPSKKVIVKPIMRMRNPMVNDPNHEAYFLFGSATIDYCLPSDKNNNLINPFTSKEEQRWLEKALDADLNIYKKTEDNFWKKHKVRLGKEERPLNLESPKDYLDYLILKANKLYIAPDGESMLKKATYRFALVAEEFEVKAQVKSSDKKKKAYKEAARLEEKGKDFMLNFLKVYGHRASPESKAEFLVAQIDQIIEDDIDGFLKIVDDKNYEYKLIIANAVEVGAVTKKGRLYYLPGGDALCGPGETPVIEVVVKYLLEPANSDILLALKARIDDKRKK
jgi:hypothetical protein